MKQITQMTVSEISALIRQRKISPSELVEEAIRVTKRLQDA